MDAADRSPAATRTATSTPCSQWESHREATSGPLNTCTFPGAPMLEETFLKHLLASCTVAVATRITEVAPAVAVYTAMWDKYGRTGTGRA